MMGRSSSYNQSRISTQSKNSGALNGIVMSGIPMGGTYQGGLGGSPITNHELGLID
jgi:hypothetical protein